jgi:hypothetical protein
MSITAIEWRERETFLVNLQNLRRQIADASRRIAELQGRAGREGSRGTLQSLVQQAGRLASDAGGLASEFNGGGVRQGTLFGPNEVHRERIRRIESGLAELLEMLEGAEGG